MVIAHQEEQEIPDQGEMNLALEADLPKIMGLLDLKAADRFEGRKGSSLQVMSEQHPSDSIPMDG